MFQELHPFLGRDLYEPVPPGYLVLAWLVILVLVQLLHVWLPAEFVLIVQFGLLFAVGFWAWHHANHGVDQRTQWWGPSSWWGTIGLGVLVAIPTWLALNIVVSPLIVAVFDAFHLAVPPIQVSTREALTQGGVAAIFNAVVTVFVAPIAEEVFFRGAFFSSMTTRYGLGVGLLAQAVFFGFVHFNPIVVVVTTILGLINGWMMMRRVALVLPIVIHIVFNLLSVIVVLLQSG